MKKYLALLCATFALALNADTWTDPDTGIAWTYTITDGQVTIGTDDGKSSAISTSTKGNLIIPSTLGGCPVTSIGDYAFYPCGRLTSVIIPEGVTNIGSYAFSGCSSLTSVTIPDGVTSIGNTAFGNCRSLTSVTIPSSVTSIGYNAFEYTPFLDNQPDGLVVLGSALYTIKGECPPIVIIPDSVVSICNYAFRRCSSLTSVTIPEGVTNIGEYAFRECSSFTSVTIPSSVTSIGSGAFSGCSALMEFTVNADNPNYAVYNGLLCSKDGKEIIAATNGDVTIPDGVMNIGDSAFDGCSSLTSVTIPSSVTSIGEYAFQFCSRLTTVTIPEGVTSIGRGAFDDCRSLTSVTIPSGVTSIGDTAFRNCRSLTSVTIPSSVTSIGYNAFQYTPFLDYQPNGLVILGSALYTVKGECPPIVTIPDSVVSICRSAFAGCSSLTTVTIPVGVTNIGDSAFYNCRSLTAVAIPEGVTSIGNSAFYNCSGITSVTIHEGVTNIGYYAFEGCISLTSLTIPSSVTSIGSYAFSDCSSLTSVTIPEGVTSIGNDAFSDCYSLASVTIPSSVTNIGYYAFANCSSLVTVKVISGDAERVKGLLADSGFSINNIEFAELSVELGVWTNDFALGKAYADMHNIPMLIFWSNKGCRYCDLMKQACDKEDFCTWQVSRPMVMIYSIDEGSDHTNCKNFVTNKASAYPFMAVYWKSNTNGEEVLKLFTGRTGSKVVDGIGYYLGDYGADSNDSLQQQLMTVVDSILAEWVDALNATPNKQPDGGPYQDVVDGIKWTYTITGGRAKIGPGSYTSPAIPTSTKGNLIIPSTLGGCPVTSIGDYAFFDCSSLTSVTIPSSVTSIGEGAFDDCSLITSVTIPSSVTSIGDTAFGNCRSLTSVTIPSSVTSIGSGAFSGCSALMEFTVNADNPNYAVYNGLLCSKDGKEIIAGTNGDVTIPDGVTSIGEWAFNYCSSLTTVTIPSSVTSIGSDAFDGCDALEMITVDAGDGDRIRQLLESSGYDVSTLTFVEATPSPAEPDDPIVPVDGFAVSFLGVNGAVSASVVNYPTNGVYGSLPEARREGATFAGWYTALDGGTRVSAFDAVDPAVTKLYARWVEDDATLYAQWAANVYSVNFNANGGEGTMAPQSFLYDQTQALAGNGFVKTGYTFKGWSTTADGEVVYANAAAVSNLTAEAGFVVALFASWEKCVELSADEISEWVAYDLGDQFAASHGLTAKGYRDAFKAKFGSNYTDAFQAETGKIAADGTRLKVWHDYVAGTDPLDEKSVFSATIELVNGVPTVRYSPELSTEAAALRKYTTYGKKSLRDTTWTEVPAGSEGEYNFFKVTVEMK